MMFCIGDIADMVNMIPLMEEYRYHALAAIHWGAIAFTQKFNFRLPLMTNKIDLKEGDLLVMPFDGGLPEICCERFPR